MTWQRAISIMARFYKGMTPDTICRMTLAQFHSWFGEIHPLSMMEAGEEPPLSKEEIRADIAEARKRHGIPMPKGLE